MNERDWTTRRMNERDWTTRRINGRDWTTLGGGGAGTRRGEGAGGSRRREERRRSRVFRDGFRAGEESPGTSVGDGDVRLALVSRRVDEHEPHGAPLLLWPAAQPAAKEVSGEVPRGQGRPITFVHSLSHPITFVHSLSHPITFVHSLRHPIMFVYSLRRERRLTEVYTWWFPWSDIGGERLAADE